MTAVAPIAHPDRFYIDGRWEKPSSDATLKVLDSNDEELYLEYAAAQAADMDAAVGAARAAFDHGPWSRLAPSERAAYLRTMGEELNRRAEALADVLPRESGNLYSNTKLSGAIALGTLNAFAELADQVEWERQVKPVAGDLALVVKAPVGVVGAIVPWNGPLLLSLVKVAPALLAGCTVVLKADPAAPGAPYLIAEAAEAAGLPAGVLNVVVADREVSELLVRDPRIDKIAFTGSTAAGRRIASILGERIARFTLELGGKSPAVILDDADLESAAQALAAAECRLTGQVCASLTRLIVTRQRHDEFVDALASAFSDKVVGNAFDPASDMGPLASAAQRDRVEGYVRRGIEAGAQLVTGGGRPQGLDRGYFVEPTVFAKVDNSSVIGQEEIFGPVLSVIPADDEDDAVRIANDTIYGLNAAVFTPDPDRALAVARRLRSGTVLQNTSSVGFSIAFGGMKQSGIGREGGLEGLHAYLETQVIALDSTPARYRPPMP